MRDVPAAWALAGSVSLVSLPVVASVVGRERDDARAAAIVVAWLWGPLLGVAAWFAAGTDAPQAARTGLVAAGFPPDMAAKLTRPLFAPPPPDTGEASAPVAASAPQAEPLPSAPVRPLEGDAVVLPYEGSGHSLALPVQAGDLDLTMLFDTGATLTTMNRATLRRLGVTVPVNAPVLELRTANGPAKAPIVLLPRLWVGGVEVPGVTVGVCEPCADDEVVGLLGLNVTGRFLVTLDTARKEVSFAPRAGAEDRLLDIGPWLTLDADLRAWPDGRVKAEIHAENLATRAITAAEVALSCADDASRRWVKPLGAIGAGEQTTREVALEGAEDCATWKVALASARW